MKKSGLLLSIVVICIAIMTGCSGDTKKKYLTLDEIGSSNSGVAVEESVFYGPTSVTATDGQYKDKVGINWASVKDADSYKIYRSDSITGPFTEIGWVSANTLKNVDSTVASIGTTPTTVSTTATSGSCDVPVYQATYQSVRDIGDGIFLPAGVPEITEHYDIGVEIGGVFLGSITFKGNMDTWNWSRFCYGTWWTQDKIVQELNNLLGGHAQCYPVTVNGKRYIRIVSTNSIRLTNHYNLIGELLWPGLDFFDQGSNKDTVINVERVMIACNDTTRPTVSAVSPANGAVDIAINSKLSVAFSEPITSSTMNTSSFTLSANGSPVTGTVSNTGVFTPAAELISNTVYTATVTTAVTDLSGNHLAANYVWTFTTNAGVSYYFVDNTNIIAGSHYYYIVTALDADGNESEKSPVEEGFVKVNDNVPSKVASCSASDGQANSITVTWSAATGATYYKVYRIDKTGQTQLGGNVTGTTYTDSSVKPGLYSFKVAPFNTYGEGGNSDIDTGYRAVTDYEFFDLFYAEEESGLNRIDKLKQSGTGMLGSETIYDLAGNGRCDYNAGYDFWSGMATISMAFTNYCDFFLVLNGTQTLVADTNGTGTMTGQINVTGVYPGYVKVNMNMTNAVASGGSYTVKQSSGTAETTIPWTYVPAD